MAAAIMNSGHADRAPVTQPLDARHAGEHAFIISWMRSLAVLLTARPIVGLSAMVRNNKENHSTSSANINLRLWNRTHGQHEKGTRSNSEAQPVR